MATQFVQKCTQKNVFDSLFHLPSHLSIDCGLEHYVMILCCQQGHVTIVKVARDDVTLGGQAFGQPLKQVGRGWLTICRAGPVGQNGWLCRDSWARLVLPGPATQAGHPKHNKECYFWRPACYLSWGCPHKAWLGKNAKPKRRLLI